MVCRLSFGSLLIRFAVLPAEELAAEPDEPSEVTEEPPEAGLLNKPPATFFGSRGY